MRRGGGAIYLCYDCFLIEQNKTKDREIKEEEEEYRESVRR
jgi:hypothetical protein